MTRDPLGNNVPHNDPGVFGEPQSQAHEVPPQLDYRKTPNAGGTDIQQHGTDLRAGLSPWDHPVSPQPELPNSGYSINAAPAQPNAMTPAGSGPTMPTAVDPTDISQWDVWAPTPPTGDTGALG